MAETPKKRYSDAELEEFRQLILQKIEIAKHEVEYLQEQLTELNEDNDAAKAGNFDEGSQNFEIEHLAKMMQRQSDFIRNLEFALVRIENKTYGICTVTGELIEKKRLQLVPHTTKSIEGKEKEAKTVVPPATTNTLDRDDELDEKPVAKVLPTRKKVISTPILPKKSTGGKAQDDMDEWEDETELDVTVGDDFNLEGLNEIDIPDED